MGVVNTRVNDGNIDTFTLDSSSMEFIDTSHGVHRVIDTCSLLTPGGLGDQWRQHESMGWPDIGNSHISGFECVEIILLNLNGSTGKDLILEDFQDFQARLISQAICRNSGIGVL